jgi:hypothetical protein
MISYPTISWTQKAINGNSDISAGCMQQQMCVHEISQNKSVSPPTLLAVKKVRHEDNCAALRK